MLRQSQRWPALPRRAVSLRKQSLLDRALNAVTYSLTYQHGEPQIADFWKHE